MTNKEERITLAELRAEFEKQRKLIEALGESLTNLMSIISGGKDDHSIDEYIEKLKK